MWLACTQLLLKYMPIRKYVRETRYKEKFINKVSEDKVVIGNAFSYTKDILSKHEMYYKGDF